MSRQHGKTSAEIRRRLSIFGFGARGDEGSSPRPAGAGARLRLALHGLGPVARAFGLELSTRLDLLPPADAVELSRLEVVPAPAEGFEDRLAELVGEAELAEVEPRPFHQTATHEWRRARLADGTAVDLTLAWRGEPIEIGLEVALWRSCLDRLRAPGWEPFEPADLERFEKRLTHGLSLDHQAWALERAGESATGGMRHAEPIPRLCRPSLLVTRALGHLSAPTTDGRARDSAPAARETRRYVLAWLESALFDGWVPQPPLAAHLALDPEGKVAVRGGLWRLGDPRLRQTIRVYLAAVADGDADHALDALLELSQPLDPERTAGSLPTLRHIFRQAEPFRDGSATGAAMGGRVADLLFLHWRLLRRQGYRPRQGWASFQQGLAELEWLSRQHSEQHDVLVEALEDVRWMDLAQEGRELLSLETWPRRLAETLPALDEIDEHLRRLGSSKESRASEPPPRRRLVLLFGTAMLALLARSRPGIAMLEPWLAGAFLVLALSILLPLWLGPRLENEPHGRSTRRGGSIE